MYGVSVKLRRMVFLWNYGVWCFCEITIYGVSVKLQYMVFVGNYNVWCFCEITVYGVSVKLLCMGNQILRHITY